MSKVRLFIGIPLPESICNEINSELKPLQPQSQKAVKWVPPENFHITFKFLGSTDENKIPEIKNIICEAGKNNLPLDITVTGTGAFPRWSRPSILWIGTHDDVREPLRNLAGRLDRLLEKQLKIPREKRPFHPHITTGRIRNNTTPPAGIIEALKALDSRTWGTFTADSLVLFRSDLLPDGARYTRL